MSPELKQIVAKSSIEAAPRLLGWVLCRCLPAGVVKLKIVETEAYHQNDPASHSFAGQTKRTAPMFASGGHLYVYFTYGMHYALNIVTGPAGIGEGVLIRAAEPVEGIEIMAANRGVADLKNIASGPGKLAQALGITDTDLSGKKLISIKPSRLDLSSEADKITQIRERYKSSIWLEPPIVTGNHEVVTTTRIGIKKATHQPWRFYIKDSPFVSKAVHK